MKAAKGLTVRQDPGSVRLGLRPVEQASEGRPRGRERAVRLVHSPVRQELVEAPQECRRLGEDETADKTAVPISLADGKLQPCRSSG